MKQATLKAPFPYFGGKSAIAPKVWQWLGDPGGYIEPFAGSAAVLLSRPPFQGRRVETLNDADGLLVNAWRAIQAAPDRVADYAWGPVTELDYHARHYWLNDQRARVVECLDSDPCWFDARAAAWWLYVMSAAIGNPFETGRGEGERMHEIPFIANSGKGIHRTGNNPDKRTHLKQMMDALSKRLEHVRITCGNWTRVLGNSLLDGNATASNPHVGIFLDPPYANYEQYYSHDTPVSEQVREWCKTAPKDVRIVLTGYDSEHDELLDYGWRKHVGKATGGGHGGVEATSRERVWTSPACKPGDPTLF